MSKILFCTLFIFSGLFCSAQLTQEKLEQRKAQLQAEIREKEELLKTVRVKEKSVADQLALQTDKIKLKESLINTTEKQKKLLDDDIYINQLKINRLKKELEVLKEDYAKMIVKSYKSRSEQSRAMFLLSSENFLQAYKRAQYMKQYTSYRKAQGEEINVKSNLLLTTNTKLDGQKVEKQKLIKENEGEKKTLEKEKFVQQQIANAIKKDKKQIAAEINKKQKESKKIDRQIDKLIRDAIAAANKKTRTNAAKSNPKSAAATDMSVNKIVLTPEGKIIADNFRANRGRLIWPVEKGFVSMGFGDQAHPVYRTLKIHNSGVEITTDSGSDARAVFAGEVSDVVVLSPVNKAVVLQHGDFFTVYQNLSSVNVRKGDKVKMKENLGRIRTSGEGKTVVKFMILQNTTYNDPAAWLLNM